MFRVSKYKYEVLISDTREHIFMFFALFSFSILLHFLLFLQFCIILLTNENTICAEDWKYLLSLNFLKNFTPPPEILHHPGLHGLPLIPGLQKIHNAWILNSKRHIYSKCLSCAFLKRFTLSAFFMWNGKLFQLDTTLWLKKYFLTSLLALGITKLIPADSPSVIRFWKHNLELIWMMVQISVMVEILGISGMIGMLTMWGMLRIWGMSYYTWQNHIIQNTTNNKSTNFQPVADIVLVYLFFTPTLLKIQNWVPKVKNYRTTLKKGKKKSLYDFSKFKLGYVQLRIIAKNVSFHTT